MVICPECGEDVTEANFCKNCGAKLPEIKEEVPDKETKFCQNCGTEVDADANECPSCGFQFVVEQTKFCESCGEKSKRILNFVLIADFTLQLIKLNSALPVEKKSI